MVLSFFWTNFAEQFARDHDILEVVLKLQETFLTDEVGPDMYLFVAPISIACSPSKYLNLYVYVARYGGFVFVFFNLTVDDDADPLWWTQQISNMS